MGYFKPLNRCLKSQSKKRLSSCSRLQPCLLNYPAAANTVQARGTRASCEPKTKITDLEAKLPVAAYNYRGQKNGGWCRYPFMKLFLGFSQAMVCTENLTAGRQAAIELHCPPQNVCNLIHPA